MSHETPPVTPEQIAALPPEFRALLQAVIDHYERRITALEAEIATLKKTPRNSSLPPSTEHPHARPPPQKTKSGKKPGGQPGHPKHERALIPTGQCRTVIMVKPETCRCCDEPLTGDDPQPWRHQVWDVPEIQPLVTEYQRHRLTCPCCATSTCGELPPGVPGMEGRDGRNVFLGIRTAAVDMASTSRSRRRRRGGSTGDQPGIRGSGPHDLILRGSAGLYERASPAGRRPKGWDGHLPGSVSPTPR